MPSERVGTVRSGLFDKGFPIVDAVYIVDESGRIEGLLHLPELFSSDPDRTLSEVMQKNPPHVRDEADQEGVATVALRYRLATVPVVNANGIFLGVVPTVALLDVLRREHIEDLHRLAGIRREAVHARDSLEEPPVRRVADRLPWLMIGMIGSVLATFVMSRYQTAIESDVALAFFVPGIVYLADAIGTQTETVVVRGLSLSHSPMRILLWKELRTGLLMGSAFGAFAFLGVMLAFSDPALAAVVALTMLVAGGMATSIGLLFPWLLQRLGQDPAFGSGPIATVVQDVLSLLIYFSFGAWLLGRS